MTIEQFQETLHKVPFRPFLIRMADGRSFEVRHRDFVARSPSGRTIILYHGDDHYSILDLLLMSEIEVQSGNGRQA